MDSEIYYKSPPFFSEELPPNKIVVTIEIAGLKKGPKGTAKNALIKAEYKDRSFSLQIDGTEGKLENKHFRLTIKQLPGEINGDVCSWIVKDGFIDLTLVKAKNEKWSMEHGIETFKEEIKEK